MENSIEHVSPEATPLPTLSLSKKKKTNLGRGRVKKCYNILCLLELSGCLEGGSINLTGLLINLTVLSGDPLKKYAFTSPPQTERTSGAFILLIWFIGWDRSLCIIAQLISNKEKVHLSGKPDIGKNSPKIIRFQRSFTMPFSFFQKITFDFLSIHGFFLPSILPKDWL